MLIDCPKCGFQQPKDQYCASCGVDIPKYLKKQKKSFSGLLKSSAFQSTIIVAATVAVAFFYFKYQNQNRSKHIKENTAFMSRSLKHKSAQATDTHQESSQLENSSTAQLENTNLKDQDSLNQVQLSDLSDNQKEAIAPNKLVGKKLASGQRGAQGFNGASTQAAATTAETSLADNSNVASHLDKQEDLQITVQFFEVPSVNLNYWEQQNSHAVKAVPTDELAKLKNLKPLGLKSFKLTKEQNQIVSFEVTAPENQNDLGLGLDLSFHSNNPKLGEVNIRKRFHVRSEDSPVFNFAAAKGQTSYILWTDILSGFEHYPDLLNTVPFNILNSNHFKNNNSELIIVISVDK